MKRIQFYKTCLVGLLLCIGYNSQAANKYWYGASGTTFSTAANWSSSNAGFVGTTAPGSGDIANFGNYTGMTNANCDLTTAINVGGMLLATGYTGTVTANTASLTHTIGTSGLVINAGTFTATVATTISNTGIFTITAGTFSINLTSAVTVTFSMNGNFNQTGGTFSCTSYSGSTITVNVGGDMISSSATFTAGNSLFKLRKPSSATLTGSPMFYDLTFNPSGAAATWSIGSSPTVTNLLQYTGNFAVTLNAGTLNAQGDITIASTLPAGGGGNATLSINGGTQTLTGNAVAGNGSLPHVSIACGTLRIAGTPSVAGDWIYTSGTVDANYSSSNSDVIMCGTGNIDGQGSSSTMAFQNLTIYAISGSGTRTLTGNLLINRNLTINSTTTLSAGSNTINLGGNWNNNGTWTYSTSTVIMDGSGYNTISKASGTETFYNLTFNRPTKSHKLNNPVTVNHTLTLTKGHVKTTSTNYLELIDNATLSGGSDSAYVHGPVRKTGNDVFVFPLGDTTLVDTAYHPLAMTAPSSTGDQFEATYFAVNYPVGDSLVDSLTSVSQCEYWTLKRNAGSSTPIIYLSWNSFCDNTSYSEMRVAEWNGVKWLDKGQGSISVGTASGNVAGSLSSSFSINPIYLTIGYRNVHKPYTPVQKSIDGAYSFTDGNILYYRYNEEYKDANGFVSYQVINVATNAAVTLFNNATTVNIPVRYGVNDLKMDLYTAANTPLASGMYLLVVTNDKNETFQLRFNKN